MRTLRDSDESNQGSMEIGSSPDAFARCLDRVQAVIQDEMKILKKGERIDFDALNQRKLHALLELLCASKGAAGQNSVDCETRLKSLRTLLVENTDFLARRLKATEEITEIIVKHIRDSESDGTYSLRSPRVLKL